MLINELSCYKSLLLTTQTEATGSVCHTITDFHVTAMDKSVKAVVLQGKESVAIASNIEILTPAENQPNPQSYSVYLLKAMNGHVCPTARASKK